MNSHTKLHPVPPLPSGHAMDRRLAPPSRWRRWRKPLLGGGAVAALLVALLASLPRGLEVAAQDLALSTVARGQFRDDLLVRALVQPARSVLLDATESGRVDAVLARDGDRVEAGALLYRLSNPQREQEVMARAAEVAQQMANLSVQRAALAGGRAQLRRELAQLDHQRRQAEVDLARQRRLADAGFVSTAVLDDAAAKLELQRRLHEQLEADGRAEMATREQSIAELERAIDGLQRGLAIVRQAAAGLSARAPIAGLLSGFALQQGSSVRPGDALGRIDDASGFKLAAQVDEFYLARVRTGLAASIALGGKTWPLTVAQRLPQVKDGRFGVELAFADAMPPGLQAGQGIDLRIALGAPTDALLIADGAFYGDSGGAWVYVVGADGASAERRQVKLGRRAAGSIEVLEGLTAGERVIVSKVRQFGDAKSLRLRAD